MLLPVTIWVGTETMTQEKAVTAFYCPGELREHVPCHDCVVHQKSHVGVSIDIILQSDIVRKWNKWHIKDILPILPSYSMTLGISSIGRLSDIQSDCSSFQTWPSECVSASLILCLRERGGCGSTLERLLDKFPEVKMLDEVWGE
jgi:hypothetical protein